MLKCLKNVKKYTQLNNPDLFRFFLVFYANALNHLMHIILKWPDTL